MEQLLVFQLLETPSSQLSTEGHSVFQEQNFNQELLAFWTWLHKCFAAGKVKKRIIPQWNALLTKL